MINQYISLLDTKRFGFKIAKLNSYNNETISLIEKLKEEDVKLIIIRIEAADIESINNLEKIGFLIKDVQLIYNYTFNNQIKLNKHNGLILRESNENDIPQIIEISKQSFNNYGHYFNDSKLDRVNCLEVYSDWAKNCCINKTVADYVIVAEKEKKIAGYLAFKHFKEENYTFASLGAVNPNFRKLGIFQAINIEGLNRAEKLGFKNVRTNVLNTNFPVNSTYIDLGFKIINSVITMHYWLD
jgi:ribosomal protein S18 acetylase RimI-like enzyme